MRARDFIKKALALFLIALVIHLPAMAGQGMSGNDGKTRTAGGTPGPAVYSNSARGFSASAATTISTASFTVSGANRYILAFVFSGAGTPVAPSGVTWNGEALTQLSTTLNATAFGKFSLWAKVSPGAATGVCTATFGSAQDERGITCLSFTNTNQGTPTGTIATATGSNFSVSNTATVVSGDLVIDGAFFLDVSCNNYTWTIGGSQTQRIKIDGTDTGCEGLANSTITASSSSQAMTWTVPTATGTLEWATFAFALKGF